MCVCACTLLLCVCVCVCIDQRSTTSRACLLLSLLETGFSLNLELIVLAGLTSLRVLSPHVQGLQMCTPTWLFTQVLRLQTQVLICTLRVELSRHTSGLRHWMVLPFHVCSEVSMMACTGGQAWECGLSKGAWGVWTKGALGCVQGFG